MKLYCLLPPVTAILIFLNLLIRKVLNKNKKGKQEEQKVEAEEVIRKSETPKMLKTVIQVGDKMRHIKNTKK